MQDGAPLIDARNNVYYMAAGNSPSMMEKNVGQGSQYLWAYRDAKGEYLDGRSRGPLDAGWLHPRRPQHRQYVDCGRDDRLWTCAFMDAYHPDKVFSSIDQFGRYACSNQPGIIKWNLARLAETLMPFLASDEDKAIAAANESSRLSIASIKRPMRRGWAGSLAWRAPAMATRL